MKERERINESEIMDTMAKKKCETAMRLADVSVEITKKGGLMLGMSG